MRSAALAGALVLALGLAGCDLLTTFSASEEETATAVATDIGFQRPVDVDFVSPDRGFLLLDDGTLVATDDGGESWQPVGEVAADAVAFGTARAGFALGRDRRTILRTTDGGATWAAAGEVEDDEDFPGPGNLHVEAVGAEHGWVLLRKVLMRTEDGGANWARSRVCPDQLFAGGLDFLDQSTGLLVCAGQPATIMQRKSLWTTRDGGATWRRSRRPLPVVGFAHDLEALTPRLAYLAAGRAGIYRLAPGSEEELALYTNDGYSVLAQSWPTADVGLALLEGVLCRTDDGGGRWRPLGFAPAREPACTLEP